MVVQHSSIVISAWSCLHCYVPTPYQFLLGRTGLDGSKEVALKGTERPEVFEDERLKAVNAKITLKILGGALNEKVFGRLRKCGNRLKARQMNAIKMKTEPDLETRFFICDELLQKMFCVESKAIMKSELFTIIQTSHQSNDNPLC